MGKHKRQAAQAAHSKPLSREVIANSLAIISAASFAVADDGVFSHDRVTEANDSLFDNRHYSEPLTNYAVGWRDESGLDEALEFYAPSVPVSKKFEYMEFNNADSFESNLDDERAIHEDFKQARFGGEIKINKVVNRGLKICVDEDEVDGDPNWRERKTGYLMMQLKRNSLRRAIALLKAAATNSSLVWDTSAGKDPDMDLVQALVASADDSGMMANRVGYGHTAWSKRLISHRAQDNAGGAASSGLTPELLAGFLSVDQVHTTKSRYQQGASKQQILANEVLAFTAASDLSWEDPSNIKRFVNLINGAPYRVYERQVDEKRYHIVVEHYEKTLITSLLGIQMRTIS